MRMASIRPVMLMSGRPAQEACDHLQVYWNRESVIDALTSDEPADAACRAALLSGAIFAASDQPVDSAELLTIYSRRERHLRERSIATIGLDTAVDRLETHGGPVAVVDVHARDFNFVIWLDPVKPVVISCLAVSADAANPDWARES
jgi:hypothetical protein